MEDVLFVIIMQYCVPGYRDYVHKIPMDLFARCYFACGILHNTIVGCHQYIACPCACCSRVCDVFLYSSRRAFSKPAGVQHFCCERMSLNLRHALVSNSFSILFHSDQSHDCYRCNQTHCQLQHVRGL